MPPRPNVHVLFVCLHGSAKSVVAATHLGRMAESRGLQLRCASAGIEPDEAIPPHVIAGLAKDGLTISEIPPQAVTAALTRTATHVVSFGCDVSTLVPSERLTIWGDVPAVSDGYEAARDAIVARLALFIDALAQDQARVAERPQSDELAKHDAAATIAVEP